MGDPLRDVERAIEQARDCGRRVERLQAERDAAQREATQLREWLHEMTRERDDLAVEHGTERARVVRLRAVASWADRVTPHWRGSGHDRGGLRLALDALRPGDLADETQEAPGRREGEPGAEEG